MKLYFLTAVVAASSCAFSQTASETPEALLQRRIVAHRGTIAKWDANKDGKLSEDEITAFHNNRFEWTKAEGKKIALEKMDTDKDGLITVEERWRENALYRKSDIKHYIERFKLDKDGDGKISEEERQASQADEEFQQSMWARRRSYDHRMQFDTNKDGKLTGKERETAFDLDVDLLIWDADTNHRAEKNAEGKFVTIKDPWDGIFSKDELMGMTQSILDLRFDLEKSDGDANGVVSNGEKEAAVLPEPLKRTITDTAGRKSEVTIVDASPTTAKLVGKSGTTYFPLSSLSAGDRKIVADWMGAASYVYSFRPLKLTAADGLEVTADFYDVGDKAKPVILYGHRAGSSRGEYRLIASRLAKQGYNGLSVDMRVGDSFAGVLNETNAAYVKKEGGKTDLFFSSQYDKSEPDFAAAFQWIKQQGFTGPIILWGSSYSSSLAIVLAAREPSVDAVLAFAPGEWLKKKGSVSAAAAKLARPTLAIQPEQERKMGDPVFAAFADPNKIMHMSPEVLHGSNTLLKAKNRAETWEVVLKFLGTVKDAPVRQLRNP